MRGVGHAAPSDVPAPLADAARHGAGAVGRRVPVEALLPVALVLLSRSRCDRFCGPHREEDARSNQSLPASCRAHESETKMTKYDLSLVPHDQLFSELARRYPAGVLTFLYQPDGKPGVLDTRVESWKRGSDPEVLGLAEFACLVMQRNIMATVSPPRPSGPLDDPDVRRPPTIGG